MKSVIAIHNQERGVMKKDSTERKSRNKMRHVCEDYEFYLDKHYPFIRVRCQGEKYENLVVTSELIISKEKSLHVVKRVWRELDAKDIEFVVVYNRKVNHNENTYEIDVPANFCELFKYKYSTPR